MHGGQQTSHLSQISQIIFVEKKLSCGEILEKFWEIVRNFGKFCHNLRAFIEKLRPKVHLWRKNMRSALGQSERFAKKIQSPTLHLVGRWSERLLLGTASPCVILTAGKGRAIFTLRNLSLPGFVWLARISSENFTHFCLDRF